jgi:hypothetical protein
VHLVGGQTVVAADLATMAPSPGPSPA